MFKFIKSLFGVKAAETVETVEVVQEPVVEVKPKSKPKAKKVVPTTEELMAMTKKEMIQYAKDHDIEVKDNWTKKNIAAEIVAKS